MRLEKWRGLIWTWNIDEEAAAWLIARAMEAPSPEECARFEAWMDSDIRRRVAFVRLESAWSKCESVRHLRPLDGTVDPDLLTRPDVVSRFLRT
jgi:ferric-dicitrate binding protein FerR (iron transport regulator)